MFKLKFPVLFLLGFPLIVGACDMHHDTWVSQSKVEVSEEIVEKKVDVKDVNKSVLESYAAEYTRYGDGPVSLTVTYDPHSKNYTAMAASEDVAQFAALMKKRGAHQVLPGILPVRKQGDNPYLLVSYQSFGAHAPSDCSMMAGIKDNEIEADPKYGLGCTVQSMLAKQVSRPKDLLGTDLKAPTTDGRRAHNKVEVYRMGEQNSPLQGESASGN